MSAALPSPDIEMTFGYSPLYLPLRIMASYAAATPDGNEPPEAICVWAHGTVYGVDI
jgi:hypothetical protein